MPGLFKNIYSTKISCWLSAALICCCLLFTENVLSQVIGDYQSRANGNWTNNSTWEKYNGNAWVSTSPGDYPDGNTTNVFINSHIVILNGVGGQDVLDLTINIGGKLYCNDSTGSNVYLNVFGNILDNGIVGNSPLDDNISFNIEAQNCVIGGIGSVFSCRRVKKETNFSSVTNLTVDRNIETTFLGTQLYNNQPGSVFNVTIKAGLTWTCRNEGSVSIDGVSGNGSGNMHGTFTVNGTLSISGSLYLKTDNITTGNACNVIVGTTGTLNVDTIRADASGAATHSFSILPSGRLNITGTGAFYTFSNTNNNYNLSPGSIVEYSAAGNNNVEAGLSYSNLIISGSGTKTATGNVTVGSSLALVSGLYAMPTRNTTIAPSGTLNCNGGNFAAGALGGTLGFAGDGTILGSSAVTFNTLQVNSGTVISTLNNCTATTLNLTGGFFNIGAARIFNIAASGVVTASLGRMVAGANAGNINFLNNAIIYGDPQFYDATINGGVNFQNNASVYHYFTIKSGGFVNTNAPNYISGSTLIYDINGHYDRRVEWSQGAGPGYPIM